MSKPALHILALPHTTLTDRDLSCAYSMKVRKWGKMMRPLGYRVILYGPDISDAECDEHVVIATQADRERWGYGDPFDTAVTPFLWDANQPYWRETNERAITAIRERADKQDILLTWAGWCQHPVSAATGVMTAEPGIGYEGVFSDFKAFESYAWMHHVYGIRAEQDKNGNWRNGRYYDAVIPNYFNVDDFHRVGHKDDYLLFIGRVIERKGPHVAAMIAERAGLPLVVAGPGVTAHGDTWLISAENNFRIESKAGIRYVGTVGPQERAELMARTRAVLVPTIYIEPFGGVAVEAMLSGTPVVASDWGAFTETVEEGLTGYRFRTLQEGADAVREAMTLNGHKIRKRAIERYSLEAVGKQFDRWLMRLHGLWNGGWDS